MCKKQAKWCSSPPIVHWHGLMQWSKDRWSKDERWQDPRNRLLYSYPQSISWICLSRSRRFDRSYCRGSMESMMWTWELGITLFWFCASFQFFELSDRTWCRELWQFATRPRLLCLLRVEVLWWYTLCIEWYSFVQSLTPNHPLNMILLVHVCVCVCVFVCVFVCVCFGACVLVWVLVLASVWDNTSRLGTLSLYSLLGLSAVFQGFVWNRILSKF